MQRALGHLHSRLRLPRYSDRQPTRGRGRSATSSSIRQQRGGPLLWAGSTLAGLLVMAAASGPAQAAASSKQRRPAAVQKVLDHLASHPLTITSQLMQYDAAPTTPLPPCLQGLTPADLQLPGCSHPDFAVVLLAALQVACGGLDQAHNLVTPLSWGSWTPYAGAPRKGSPAARQAAYVHALIHRQEGACDGEFGTGFSNANYWHAAAGEQPWGDQLLAVARKAAAGNPQLEQHVAGHGSSWRPSQFVALCAAAAGGGPRCDPATRQFCEAVMAAELELLVDHCCSAMVQ